MIDFGVSGKLIMNALVMYDRQTESLWSQILGVAVEGPLAGRRLEQVPALMTTWRKWAQLHPDTRALDIGRAARDSYRAYYAGDEAGILGESRADTRLPKKELVTGVSIDGAAAAYPWRELEAALVVNDVVGETPVLVVHDAATRTTALFDRRAAGRVLCFQLKSEGERGAVLIDEETGSEWSAWNGASFDGPLSRAVLTRLPATSAFWFAWKDFYPETRVYMAP